MKVRALPICRYPVGDGAKRTRSMNAQYSLRDRHDLEIADTPVDGDADGFAVALQHQIDAGIV